MGQRFFIHSLHTEFTIGALLTLSGREYQDEIKHMGKVMRLQAGAEILVSDGKGNSARAEILEITRDMAALKIIALDSTARSLPPIWLCQAVLKGPKMDWLIEKATEIGVRKIFPALTEFTVAAQEESQSRVERWERISIAALKQSGALYLPDIGEARDLTNIVSEISKNTPALRKIALHPESASGIASPSLLQLLQKSGDAAGPLFLVIGPEGGLSPKEVDWLKTQGFSFAHLGQQILRGETAAIVATALCQHFLESI